jgi:peptidoglycan/LPS O-acetylase OafA/YrhL
MNPGKAHLTANISDKDIPANNGQPNLATPLNESVSSKKISHSIRIIELDGLRGIAILLVVSFHYLNNQLLESQNSLGKVLGRATQFGWLGVDLFFVLSGFLIGTILIANKGSQNYFKTFFLRRVLRIVPNYFLLLLCFTIIWKCNLFSDNYYLTGNNNIPLWSYYAMLHNVFMALHNSLGNDALNITWSIGVEEQFYIFFPFLVFLFNVRWLHVLLIGLIIFASIFRAQFHNWVPTYVLLPSRVDGLSMGFLVAWFNNKGVISRYKQPLTTYLIGAIIFFVIGCGYLYWKYDDLGPAKHTLFAVVFASFLVLALVQPRSAYGALLRTKALVWVGQISYSLYLFHTLLLGLAHQLTGQKMNRIQSGTDVLMSILAFLLSLLFSWLVYRRLEKPMVTLGKRFKY